MHKRHLLLFGERRRSRQAKIYLAAAEIDVDFEIESAVARQPLI